jgi:hypothetical protein
MRVTTASRPPPAARPDRGGGHQRHRQHEKDGEPAQPRHYAVRLIQPGHVPDLGERAAQSQCHPESRPQRSEQPYSERRAASGEGLNLVGELRANHRDLGEGRVEDVVVQRRVVLEHEPEDRDEGEQQWEQREERVERHQRAEARRAVLAELLNHRDRESADDMPALPAVERRDDAPHEVSFSERDAGVRSVSG